MFLYVPSTDYFVSQSKDCGNKFLYKVKRIREDKSRTPHAETFAV